MGKSDDEEYKPRVGSSFESTPRLTRNRSAIESKGKQISEPSSWSSNLKEEVTFAADVAAYKAYNYLDLVNEVRHDMEAEVQDGRLNIDKELQKISKNGSKSVVEVSVDRVMKLMGKKRKKNGNGGKGV